MYLVTMSHNVNVLTVMRVKVTTVLLRGFRMKLQKQLLTDQRQLLQNYLLVKLSRMTRVTNRVVDGDTGRAIHFELIVNGYIDKKGVLTDKYYEDKANGELKVAEEVADSAASVIEIIDSIYDSRAMQPENARSNNIELEVDEKQTCYA